MLPPEIPRVVDDTEPVVRSIHAPFHVNSQGKVKKQALDSPLGKDEVSVTRIQHSDFLK